MTIFWKVNRPNAKNKKKFFSKIRIFHFFRLFSSWLETLRSRSLRTVGAIKNWSRMINVIKFDLEQNVYSDFSIAAKIKKFYMGILASSLFFSFPHLLFSEIFSGLYNLRTCMLGDETLRDCRHTKIAQFGQNFNVVNVRQGATHAVLGKNSKCIWQRTVCDTLLVLMLKNAENYWLLFVFWGWRSKNYDLAAILEKLEKWQFTFWGPQAIR